ncbi:MAG: 3'-5' exonuclease domain-containing protein 2 [Bacteroidales bacterium]|nr:3'-5' exonuclease domain-containing protein 2 [Bacteroidales bacterium]
MKKFAENITTEELNNLPKGLFEGEILLVDDFNSLEIALDEIASASILGFDTETKPCFKKGESNLNKVALLQLSTPEKAWLFRLNRIGFPLELQRILADPQILKVGLAIRDDLKNLKKIHGFNPVSFVDMAEMAGEYGIKEKGLKKLAGIILGIRISKNQRLSNWELTELSEAQMRYAATDAWVCNILYRKLTNQLY